MVFSYYLFWFFGLSTNFVIGSVAHEAIIGGDETGIQQFSYQVSLLFDGYGHDCGGGILGDLHILTTAHCVVEFDGEIDPTPITILAGTDNLYRTGPPAVKFNVTKIYVPTEYKSKDIHTIGDIAVLKLKPPGLLHHRDFKRLELPSKHHDDIFNGKTAMIAGFGWNWVTVDENKEHGGNSNGHLRFAEAIVVSHGKHGCYQELVHEKQICARIKQHTTNKPRGTCTGDSGGPLVYEDRKLIGILSKSPSGCLEDQVGSVYTRVSQYLDFIEKAVRDEHHHNIRIYNFQH